VLEDGDGEGVASTASLEEAGFASELRGLSLSTSVDSIEPVSAFREEASVDCFLVAVRAVDCVADFERVFAPLSDFDAVDLFVPALVEAPDLVWLVTLAWDSLELV
jgi:hypothetical protein